MRHYGVQAAGQDAGQTSHKSQKEPGAVMRAVLRLALLQARRDRGTLAAWILGIAGLGYAAATAVTTQFGEDNERAALISVAAASPAFLFLRGLSRRHQSPERSPFSRAIRSRRCWPG